MLTIVVAEDDRLIRESLALTLADEIEDCRVLQAPDGRAAVGCLQSGRVDLIVTDLTMPEMNGFELIEHRNRFFPDIPVVVMTADASPQVLAKLNSLGVRECLEKPFDYSAAVRMVRSALPPSAEALRKARRPSPASPLVPYVPLSR